MIRPRPAVAIAAILLPPLGVFLDRGLGAAFWITTGLTCLAFVPGAIFALYTVSHAPLRPPAHAA
ncbi:YqaE/Pmp3 family membrane protein [Flavisphingomonas formosensis]|uniref:YqaE/Pmp3 family membrane protein n=1 Tax=Flavisphingomonas formosensis TaxID=861534 RepID=UPI0012FCAE4D|nr:YqaE/Pmp3 family membrane protein [Sphingomonas formosensis]